MRRDYRTLSAALAAAFTLGLLTSCGRHSKTCTEYESTPASYVPDGPPPPPDVLIKPSVESREIPVQPNSVKQPEVIKPTVVSPDVVKVQPNVERPDVGVVAQGNRKPIRIKAGSATNWRDKQGNEWLADAGFVEGAMLNHGEIAIDKTDNADLYKSERSSVEKFAWPVPNGKYTVKLHFSENHEDVKKAGERVFSIDVNGEKIKNLDIYKEAGGSNKALVKTVKVHVNTGRIEINFIKSEQREPLINGIEILPE